MMVRRSALPGLLLVCLLVGAAAVSLHAAEGMYPMSELAGLDLSTHGLTIAAEAIYNPDGLSLVDGICKLGGCTGSFVSADGLLLTNHHCAYRAVQNISTTETDYLANGYLAALRAEEAVAKGYTVRITESYRDISAEVLGAISPALDPAARTKAIEERTKTIILETEAANPGKRAEVAEMFIGKTYVLFLYTYLKDVRLVYAPPRAIGNFGGEVDNWMWPRHTGDFSFMRAYVGPDGQPAEPSPENIPYRPRKVLPVAPAGVDEGDPVFIFGYPGRTYRHRTSFFLAYESEVHMPWVVEWYGWQIELLESITARDPEAALRLAPRLRGLHNRMKNYRGKINGIGRMQLLAAKRQEEQQLQAFIDADPDRRAEYGNLLERIKNLYDQRRVHAEYEMWFDALLHSAGIMYLACTTYEATEERQKPDHMRESAYMERNLDQLRKRLQLKARSYDETADRAILAELFARGLWHPEVERIDGITYFVGKDQSDMADIFLTEALQSTRVTDAEYLMEMLEKYPEDLAGSADVFLQLAAKLYPFQRELRQEEKRRKGILDELHAQLIEVKRAYLGTDFIPDANGTLRLTYGNVRGYTSAAGVAQTPLTSLAGLVAKSSGEFPFLVPADLAARQAAGDFGDFASPALHDVPVNMLYDCDTTGGSSGSPVFNARGELVGVNFDRAWEATINDFAWHEDYSRSIAVDIRYVLWVASKLGGADRLLAEMGIPVTE